MANRFPLIVDNNNLNIKELPAGDNLDLTSSDIVNVGNITLASGSSIDLLSGSMANVGSITMVANTTISHHTSTVSVHTIGDTGTYANLDISSFNFFTANAATDTTFQFQNTPTGNVGVSFILELSNGGDHTITWPNTVRWPSNTAPTLSTTDSTDMFVFFSDNDGVIWRAAYQTGYITI